MSTKTFDRLVGEIRQSTATRAETVDKLNSLLTHAQEQTQGVAIEAAASAQTLLEALFAEEVKVVGWQMNKPPEKETGNSTFSKEILLGTRGAGWIVIGAVYVSTSGSPVVTIYYWWAPSEYEDTR